MKKLLLTLFLLLPLSLVGADLPLTSAQKATITANGSYEIRLQGEGEKVLEVGNAFGGGTVTVFYMVSDPADPSDPADATWTQFDVNGDYTINASDQFTSAFAFAFKSGAAYIRITLAGATSPDIDISVKKL